MGRYDTLDDVLFNLHIFSYLINVKLLFFFSHVSREIEDVLPSHFFICDKCAPYAYFMCYSKIFRR